MIFRVVCTFLGLVVIAAILIGIKALQIEAMIEGGKNVVLPPETVTAFEVQSDSWESTLNAVASLEAVEGVTVSAEVSGKVVEITFEAGDSVEKGALLVKLDTLLEEADLAAAEARLALTELSLKRSQALLAKKAIAQSEFDNADAEYKEAVASVASIKVQIEKKTIYAPFSGRLGIREVNRGQILREGDPIVSLQSLNPIFVNFTLPQKRLLEVKPGLSLRVMTDALSGQTLLGQITAVSPAVDPVTRNIQIQATLANPDERLLPGMFARVQIIMPEQKTVTIIPSTAISYATYGDSVFVVEEKKDKSTGALSMVVRQQFVRTGERRGDFIAIVDGVNVGEQVVSTGVFKLRNAVSVVVDNSLAPEFKLNPSPEDS